MDEVLQIEKKKKVAVVCQDVFSRYVLIANSPTELLESFCQYGVPRLPLCDRGGAWLSYDFVSRLESLGGTLLTAPVGGIPRYHGRWEVLHRYLRDTARCVSVDHPSREWGWLMRMRVATNVHNNTRPGPGRFSPSELMFVRPTSFYPKERVATDDLKSLEYFTDKFETVNATGQKYADNLAELSDEIHAVQIDAYERLEAEPKLRPGFAPIVWCVGDEVWVRISEAVMNDKDVPRWEEAKIIGLKGSLVTISSEVDSTERIVPSYRLTKRVTFDWYRDGQVGRSCDWRGI